MHSFPLLRAPSSPRFSFTQDSLVLIHQFLTLNLSIKTSSSLLSSACPPSLSQFLPTSFPLLPTAIPSRLNCQALLILPSHQIFHPLLNQIFRVCR
ncbi:unnamed protein product [Linum trigynum]|uniref:Uncharacterized protein n=1 Tax=Linum trigynum TaxID=586398 RepID=A0AAV2FYL8_9ROSI